MRPLRGQKLWRNWNPIEKCGVTEILLKKCGVTEILLKWKNLTRADPPPSAEKIDNPNPLVLLSVCCCRRHTGKPALPAKNSRHAWSGHDRLYIKRWPRWKMRKHFVLVKVFRCSENPEKCVKKRLNMFIFVHYFLIKSLVRRSFRRWEIAIPVMVLQNDQAFA